MSTTKFELQRNTFGKLVLTNDANEIFEDVMPVRAFPIQSPLEGISMVLTDGREVAWIDRLTDLSDVTRQLVLEELEGREFIPEIQRINNVSSFALPCTWFVSTDRGETEFVLRGDEDIRRIGATSLLVTDNHGIQFLIREIFDIDRHSRKILDRFL